MILMNPKESTASRDQIASYCSCRHLEYDPLSAPHVYIIAQRTA